jgi:hypothetical protein
MNAYIKFLNESVGIPKPHDSTARDLLDLVCLHEGMSYPLTVTQVMNQPQLASPATMHRKLEDLLELGLVTHQHQGKNRRTKYVVLTTQGQLYSMLMSQAMERAMQ